MGIIAESWLVDQNVQLKVHRATGAMRALGVLKFGTPKRGQALLFRDCRSVHGVFMHGALDVVFIDDRLRVVRIAQLRPWRFKSCRAATHTLELAPGECARLGIAAGTFLKNI